MTRKLVLGLLATSMLVVPGILLAKEVAKTDKPQVDYERLMKRSDDGFKSMRDIRAARLAIFNGRTDAAGNSIDTAIADLDKTKVDAKSFEGRSNSARGAQDWVPIDASLDIADNFVPTKEKTQHIAKANEHFKAGDKQKAVEALKLADIDVNYTRVMMPLATTQDHVKAAKSLMGEKKYFEANLALKAAEDGLVVDSVALVEVPKSGDTAKTPAAKADTPANPSANSTKK